MTPKEITSKRANNYGHPRKNFQNIADYLTVYLRDRLKEGESILPEDVPMMMILTKVARESYKHHDDNILDIQGYAETGKML